MQRVTVKRLLWLVAIWGLSVGVTIAASTLLRGLIPTH